MGRINEEQIAKDYIGLDLILEQLKDEIKNLREHNKESNKRNIKIEHRLSFLEIGLERISDKLHDNIFEGDL